jgi:Uncharacterized protein conserved in bacteria
MKVSGPSKTKPGGAAQIASGGGRNASGSAVSGAAGAPGATFAEVEQEMEVRALLAELDDIGGQLSRHPSTALVGRYKELVRIVLEKARNGMKIRREFKWRRTERSMFVTIERTEDALVELDEALSREGDRTRLLSLVDEIKGCLISLFF